MSEIFFVLKVMVLSALTVVLLQVPWGDQTLEERGSAWLMNSKAGQSIQTAAAGGVLFVREATEDLVRKAKKLVKSGGETTDRAAR